jgi:hypothetical protein
MSKRTSFSKMLIDLVSFMLANDDYPILDYLKRSTEEQRRLYELGLSKCDGKIKLSQHQKGLAIDIYLARPDGTLKDWNDEGKGKFYHDYWETLGGAPEISWDVGHFEAR